MARMYAAAARLKQLYHVTSLTRWLGLHWRHLLSLTDINFINSSLSQDCMSFNFHIQTGASGH